MYYVTRQFDTACDLRNPHTITPQAVDLFDDLGFYLRANPALGLASTCCSTWRCMMRTVGGPYCGSEAILVASRGRLTYILTRNESRGKNGRGGCTGRIRQRAPRLRLASVHGLQRNQGKPRVNAARGPLMRRLLFVAFITLMAH